MNLLDIVFPKVCLGCEKNGSYLCFDCVNYLKSCQHNVCPYCLKSSRFGQTHLDCLKKTNLKGLTAVFWQNRILKKALYKLRQKGVTDLKNTLLEIALSCLGEHQALVEIIQTEKPLFNPLPLSKKQENKQGFNQAELLGKDLAKSLGLTYVPEVGEVKKGIKTGSYKSLLLFNDLWDRQSFLSVADSLKHKGISRVWALVLAR